MKTYAKRTKPKKMKIGKAEYTIRIGQKGMKEQKALWKQQKNKNTREWKNTHEIYLHINGKKWYNTRYYILYSSNLIVVTFSVVVCCLFFVWCVYCQPITWTDKILNIHIPGVLKRYTVYKCWMLCIKCFFFFFSSCLVGWEFDNGGHILKRLLLKTKVLSQRTAVW